MESNKTADLNALNVITYSLMAGLILFGAIVYYQVSSGSAAGSEAIISPQTDLLLVGGFGAVCLLMSRFLSGKLLSAGGDNKPEYPAAMARYRSAKIIRLALLEGPGLMACVFALVTGNLNLLLIAGFMVGMMWLARPSAAEFSEWWG
jgi:hypothetical protein